MHALANCSESLVMEGNRGFDSSKVVLARSTQRNLACGSVQKLCADRSLELRDPLRDDRCSEIKRFSRGSEAARLRHRRKRTHVLKHVHYLRFTKTVATARPFFPGWGSVGSREISRDDEGRKWLRLLASRNDKRRFSANTTCSCWV